MNCHICGSETNFTCNDCNKSVCEDCCVVPTYGNQIDYALCTECWDSREVVFWRDRDEERKQEEAERIKKEKRKKARFENYWKPENIEKRRKAKEEKIRLKIELKKKQMKETVNRINSMFRGMF